MTKTTEAKSKKSSNHKKRSVVGKLFDPRTPYKLVPIHENSLPGGKNSLNYTIDSRRVVNETLAKVPVDVRLEHNSSIVCYPRISSKYFFFHRLFCVICFASIPTLVTGWVVLKTLTEDDYLENIIESSNPIFAIPLLFLYWILFATISRALGQRIPSDFVTEKAFYHKGITRTGDTHAFSLLEKIGQPHESIFRKIGSVPFTAWGCIEEKTARITDPKDFANILAKFRPSSIAAFPRTEEKSHAVNDNNEDTAQNS